ncbi:MULTISPECIES: thioesterase family protein [Thermoactinomyces]|uniref:Acyl-CoA thioesterase n=1 Tax=Thermoactinomyces daqus TaxID=1329516 RepID=A0A7W1XC55_9BACL|nr:thioesterase family protein [Thermoactinomyces daqus]MBA4543817.1 acyl-CoA thioesterase [Thermoactinomyces daqus]MBH8599184.1 acyl-CoA thioesterase [Thermoactinomyces sp. CICC 10523]MBH8605395.1 acyl-CoA thioesterase [Thermoactinomyces sp. CICC 10522]MBH8609472.1 acyl-CoA thioesterase [Thermoactinomyces sp. CICC 10521]
MIESEIRVRFCETDALGHVNNTSYFIYLEQGRTEFFEEIATFADLSDWPFILAHIRCDFLQQAYYNQRLTIQTGVLRIGTRSVHLGQQILDRESGEVIARSESVMVYFNFLRQRSEPIPDGWKAKLNAYSISWPEKKEET